MISEGDRWEVLVSPSIWPQRNNLRTMSLAETEPSHCSSGAGRMIGQTVVYSPLPNLHGHAQLSIRAINDSAQWPHGQLTLPTQQHPNLNSSHGSYGDANRLRKDCPLLTKFLTTSNSSNDMFPYPQQSKTTPQSAAKTSTHSNRSTTMHPVSKRYLDDNQILQLIEKKLAILRGQMKKMNLMSTCSQSPPSKLNDYISKDLGVKIASDNCRNSPELLKMKSNGAATAKQTKEYVAIMQEAAALCSKKEAECPVVLKAPGCSATLEEFVKQNPSLNFHHTPSHQDYQSVWRNNPRIDEVKESDVHALKDIMKVVNNQSKLSESTPTLSALESSLRVTCPVAENTSDTSLPHSSDDHENEKEHFNQNSDPNTDYADKSSGTDGHVKMKHEPEGFTEETQDKEVQTRESIMERGVFDCKLEGLKNSQYDDSTDDEGANLTAQNSTLDTSIQNKNIGQNCLPEQPIQLLANTAPTEKVDIDLSTIQTPKISVPMQLEDITDDDGPDDERPVTGVGSIQVLTSRSPEQKLTMNEHCCTIVETEQTVKPSPKQHLVCACPIFVETEDGFVEGLCPKCVQDISQRQEGGSEDYAGLAFGLSRHDIPMDPQSEYDDDDCEWFVVPFKIHDIRLEQEIFVLDDIEDGSEENKKPSTLEQLHQPSLSCFQKLPEYDSLESFYQSAFEKFNQKLPVVDFSALHNELLPSPNNLPSSASASCAEAEDSCDTDDSSDYPLQPKCYRLTPSSQLCEKPQPQETIRPGLPSESKSSNTHDEYSTNNAANSTTVTERPSNETSPNKESVTHHRKRKFKSRVFDSDSDDDDDFNQDKPSKYRRNASLVSGQASTCASGSAESEIPQPQETVMPELSSELLSSNTFSPDEDSTNNAVNNSTVTERPGNEMSTTHLKKERIKSRACASDSVADLNQDKNSNHGRNSSTASGQASALHNQLTRKSGSAKKEQSSTSVSHERSAKKGQSSTSVSHERSAKKGQSSASVSHKESSHTHQNQAVKEESSSTTSTSKHRKEQRRQERPNEASMGVVPDMPEKPQSKGNAASGIPNGKKTANTNASQTTKQNSDRRSLSQPVPNKGPSTFPVSKSSRPAFVGAPLLGVLSLNGEPYQASSLPGNHRIQSKPQPKPQKSSIEKTNRVNSYSTDKSTPARKKVVADWENGHVETPALSKRRRSSDTSARTTMTKKANGRDQETKDHPSARPKHNSHDTPLLKKTKSDAMALMQQTSRQPTKERNFENQFAGFKWKGQKDNNDLDFDRKSPELPRGLYEQ